MMFTNILKKIISKTTSWLDKYNDWLILFVIGGSFVDHIRLFMGLPVSPGWVFYGWGIIATELLVIVVKRIYEKSKSS